MTTQKKTILIIAVGALGLYAFYRYRKGLPIFGGFGSAMAGQGTQGGSTSNPSATGSGSTNLPQVPVQSMNENERIRLRNLATGPLSRSQCLINVDGRRWIDTQTAPYYGLCVTQANFTRWVNAGYTFPGDSQPTLDFVKRVLGL